MGRGSEYRLPPPHHVEYHRSAAANGSFRIWTSAIVGIPRCRSHCSPAIASPCPRSVGCLFWADHRLDKFAAADPGRSQPWWWGRFRGIDVPGLNSGRHSGYFSSGQEEPEVTLFHTVPVMKSIPPVIGLANVMSSQYCQGDSSSLKSATAPSASAPSGDSNDSDGGAKQT